MKNIFILLFAFIFQIGICDTPEVLVISSSGNGISAADKAKYDSVTLKVNKTTTVNGNALSGNITLTRSSFAVGDSATNSVQGFMTGADHTKLMNMQANAALSNQTFINDSIDCSRVGGTNYLSYTVASNITLTGKRTGRVSGGYILVKLVGNGTNTVTLEATNMVYASGVPAFDKTLNKVNVLVIVWVWGSTTVPSATYPYLIVSNISF